MLRKLLIFGNGLGKALNSAAFSLEQAIDHAWHHDLNDTERDLMAMMLPEGTRKPEKASDLVSFHSILEANRSAGIHHTGRETPLVETMDSFAFYVARQFHGTRHRLPAAFTDSLSEFISTTRSHIATLNTDDLLYTALTNKGILNGYQCPLTDGLLSGTFAEKNLPDARQQRLGCFLHLYGSPAFYSMITDQGDIAVKKRSRTMPLMQGPAGIRTHLMLTHQEGEAEVISTSPLLSACWHKLDEVLQDVEEIILCGYSGTDPYFNQRIRECGRSVPVTVIEWHHSDPVSSDSDSLAFWRSQLTSSLQQPLSLIRMDNITSFHDWEEPLSEQLRSTRPARG